MLETKSQLLMDIFVRFIISAQTWTAMFNLYVLGTNYKTLSVEERERVAYSSIKQNSLLQDLMRLDSISEAALLSTCNRTEFILISYTDHPQIQLDVLSCVLNTSECPTGFYWLEGEAAMTHIFRVICSLESMVLGEQDIYRQFKRCYLAAQEAGSVGKALERLFQQAFKLGKRARTETELGFGNVSVPQTALKLVEHELSALKGKDVLVVGAGEMAQKLVNVLALKEVNRLAIANRSEERAKELAVLNDGEQLPFNNVALEFNNFDVVFFALYSPNIILTRADLNQAKKATLCVDISVPRVVEGGHTNPCVKSFTVDDLQAILEQNIERRKQAIPRVEQLVESVKKAFIKWKNEFHILPTVIDLNQKIKHLCEAEVAKNQKFFPEESHEHLRSFARILSTRIIQMPIEQIKQHRDTDAQKEQLVALREMFNLTEMEKWPN
jgi:glutamyl-tRNA reductase